MSGKELASYILENYGNEAVVAWDIWTTEDVISNGIANDLKITEEQAEEILRRVERYKSAEEGLNWDVIECHTDGVLRRIK